jgi:hypothetical protein
MHWRVGLIKTRPSSEHIGHDSRVRQRDGATGRAAVRRIDGPSSFRVRDRRPGLVKLGPVLVKLGRVLVKLGPGAGEGAGGPAGWSGPGGGRQSGRAGGPADCYYNPPY